MSDENLAASEKELSDAVDEALSEATVVVDEVATLTSDLQRLQAEYANYRKRVDRRQRQMCIRDRQRILEPVKNNQ